MLSATANGSQALAAVEQRPDPDRTWDDPQTRPGFLRDVLTLGKARISVMAVFTGWTAIALEGSRLHEPLFQLGCLAALFLLGLGCNTFNQIFERHKDAAMARTRVRRPLPAGRIGLGTAVALGSGELLLAHVLLMLVGAGWAAAGWAAFTAVYYCLLYTLYLKPRHWFGIVVGGVPGAMGPVIAWAAAAGHAGMAAWILFAIIFLWTPPHVWALAIKLKEDYAQAGIPMLPVVKGVDETTRAIFRYTVVLVAGSLALPLLARDDFSGPLYWIAAVVLGGIFLVWTWRLWRRRPVMPTMPLFRYTLLYIGVVFLAIAIDGLSKGGTFR
ncbi:MAG: heme o synthase [Planctomycetota bacterium]